MLCLHLDGTIPLRVVCLFFSGKKEPISRSVTLCRIKIVGSGSSPPSFIESGSRPTFPMRPVKTGLSTGRGWRLMLMLMLLLQDEGLCYLELM